MVAKILGRPSKLSRDWKMKYELLECLLGCEVNKISKFWSKHQMQQNRLNRIFETPSNQEQMILSSSMNEKTYLQGFFEGVLEAIQVFSL